MHMRSDPQRPSEGKNKSEQVVISRGVARFDGRNSRAGLDVTDRETTAFDCRQTDRQTDETVTNM